MGLFLSDRTEESIFFLEKAVSILPDDATLNDHLGDAYWKANRKKKLYLNGGEF